MHKPAARSLFAVLFCMGVGLAPTAHADVAGELARFQEYFLNKHPDLPLAKYADGAFALQPNGAEELAALRRSVSLENIIKRGRALYAAPFANGKGYAACFRSNGLGIATDYPYYDVLAREVKTFEMEINECRTRHGEPPYAYGGAEMTALLAYLTETSRKNIITVVIPDNPDALAAFEKGKQFFFARRGKWNVACAHCHMEYDGKRLGDKTLSPALGITSYFPAYYGQWSEVGTLHRRFSDCMARIGAKPFPAQSEEYRNLEFFLGFMSNGVPLSGPDVRP
ncbi:MAG: sulfur oxidation c-type cytochrome SoxA [Pseudomonadota bacterium]